MTPEQEALVRKGQDSLRGAQVLASQKLFDFAVSRAYYTMFYVAEAFLPGEGLTFSKHSGVILDSVQTGLLYEGARLCNGTHVKQRQTHFLN